MRENTGGAEGGNVLWVCDRCFKYMSEGTSWESHMVGSSDELLSVSLMLTRNCRGGAISIIRRERRSTREARILFGRSMVRRKRLVFTDYA